MRSCKLQLQAYAAWVGDKQVILIFLFIFITIYFPLQ